MTDADSEFMTVGEVADRAGVSRDTVWRAIRRRQDDARRLKAVRLGAHYRIHVDWCAEWIEARRPPQSRPALPTPMQHGSGEDDAARRLDELMSYAFSVAHMYKRLRDAVRDGKNPADVNWRYLVGSSTDLTMQTLDFQRDVAPDEELMPPPAEWFERGKC